MLSSSELGLFLLCNSPDGDDISNVNITGTVELPTLVEEYKSLVTNHIATLPITDSIPDGDSSDIPTDNAIVQYVPLINGECFGSIKDRWLGSASGETSIGIFGEAEGDFSVVIGADASARSNSSVAIGYGSYVENSDYGMAISGGVENSSGGIAIGGNVFDQGALAMCGGRATSSGAMAIGPALVNGKNALGISVGQAIDDYAIAIGTQAIANGENSISIGHNTLIGTNVGTSLHYTNGIIVGSESVIQANECSVVGKGCWATADGATCIGQDNLAQTKYGISLGRRALQHMVDKTTVDDPDNALFVVGRARDVAECTNSNAIEIMQNDDLYIPRIGGYDGVNCNSTNIKKNADGTDYINPLTNKTEKIVKPLQDIIELMDARIKYLEDIIDQLTQQRNPVEP